MHVGEAGGGQRTQVPHACGVAVGEGEVAAPVRLGHRRIVAREITHVQLVDHEVGVALHGVGPSVVGPAVGDRRRVLEIQHDGGLRVRVQAQRVRVGDAVADQAHARHQHVDEEGVTTPPQVGGDAVRPDAAGQVGAHPVRGDGRRPALGVVLAVGEQAQGDVRRRGRPQGETGRTPSIVAPSAASLASGRTPRRAPRRSAGRSRRAPGLGHRAPRR